jgi:hypothetical protein
MIQRKQTIYLALVLILSIILFIPALAPFAFVHSGSSNEFDMVLNLTGISTNCTAIAQPPSYQGLLFLNVLVILFTIYAIFRYTKRPVQIKLCYVTSIFVALLMGGMWLFTDIMKLKAADPHAVYLLGFYFPLIQVVLLFMAAAAIQKDENLVRSSDRLR